MKGALTLRIVSEKWKASYRNSEFGWNAGGGEMEIDQLIEIF